MTATAKYKKKLIEVAIPLEAINVASAHEKNVRHGHPSTLHLWWARRPLAACRAVLFAQLVDDPSSNPEQFPTHESQEVERRRLFDIIRDLVKWENASKDEVLDRARTEIRNSCAGVLPSVFDPFSGGGSIPFEAQRLGLSAHASDLNPVAVVISKAMIEIPPRFDGQPPVHDGGKERGFYRHAEGLAEDIRYYGEWIREEAYRRIGHLYPKARLPPELGSAEGLVIAWIWARTVATPNPAFAGAHVPLVNSFVLSSKKGAECIVVPRVDDERRTYSFRIKSNGVTSQEIAKADEGTKAGKAQDFLCLLSGTPIQREYIRAEGKLGRLGARLMAVVVEGSRGRTYLPPAPEMETVALSAAQFPIVAESRRSFLAGATPTRAMITGGVCSAYGLDQWGKLFTDRQLVALNTLADLVQEVRTVIERDARAAGRNLDEVALRDGGHGVSAYAEAVCVYLGLAVSRLADIQNSLCRWEPSKTQVRNLFGRQAIPMLWDYGENNLFAGAAGDYRTSLGSIVKVIERFTPSGDGVAISHDAQSVSYPDTAVISTDPPYYDNIGYADLSDFFFCWLRRTLRPIFPDLFGVLATPKAEELVATTYRHGGKEQAEAFFLDGMRSAISRMASQSSSEFPATIYYAFKQREIEQEGITSTGWATFLQAIVDAGYAVVGTWPMRTEMAHRMVAVGTNALANSVVLVCRKRSIDAELVTRAEFVRALKRELPSAIADLQSANIAPADMPQSAIGPGMGVFSRYGAVLESDDHPMTVKAALQLINRELDEYLGGIQGEFDADTRFAITWFEQNGLNAGEYGTANSIATARGISVDSVRHAGIVESQASKVRILRRDELAAKWEPADDSHITIWECLQYLVRQHEADGVSPITALLLQKIGARSESVKDLAYCLYDICTSKRNDLKEATAYNALIADWTELSRQAAVVIDTAVPTQLEL